MRKYIAILMVLSVLLPYAVSAAPASAEVPTPVSVHGKLSVSGTDIIDSSGSPYQLRGVSTHGINWDVGRPYVNKEAFRTLRDSWGVNAVRLSMYTHEYNGYCAGGDKDALKAIVNNGVSYLTELGMYAIIDWHILFDNNPLINMEESKLFFDEMSHKYKDYSNVIYEICNEPNNCSWEDIKTYANEVIPVIRANDADAIIIVGTPQWSQLGNGDLSEVADSPLTGYTNIMYSLHFYAGEVHHSVYLPAKLEYAVSKGIPVFVSEFGLTEASGRGRLDTEMAGTWLDWLDGYNISYMCWSLTNISDSCALLKAGTSKLSGWEDSDLSESGLWIKYRYLKRANETSAPYFYDTAGLWMDAAVIHLARLGIVTGAGGGSFAPYREVTRAEFLTLLIRALDPAPRDISHVQPFDDIDGGEYYYEAAMKARLMGIVEGVGGNNFVPGARITRQDCFTMLYRALNALGHITQPVSGPLPSFPDWSETASYARAPIETLIRLGLIQGSDGRLNPLGTATRGESAQLVYNTLVYTGI